MDWKGRPKRLGKRQEETPSLPIAPISQSPPARSLWADPATLATLTAREADDSWIRPPPEPYHDVRPALQLLPQPDEVCDVDELELLLVQLYGTLVDKLRELDDMFSHHAATPEDANYRDRQLAAIRLLERHYASFCDRKAALHQAKQDHLLGSAGLAGLVPYQYDSIKGTSEIRVLSILPAAQHSERLKCTLSIHSLNSNIKFEAISYTWGQTDRTRTLCVNDSFGITVTPNCEDVLRSIRAPDRPREVWIDAVCISELSHVTFAGAAKLTTDEDQDSIAERTAQVSIMGDIYAAAHHTLVYLGQPRRARAPAIRIFARLSALRTPAFHRGPRAKAKLIPSHQTRWIFDGSEAWESLLAYEYFRRAWTLQEILLSRRLVVGLGNEFVTWERFTWLAGCDRQDLPNVAGLLRNLFNSETSRSSSARVYRSSSPRRTSHRSKLDEADKDDTLTASHLKNRPVLPNVDRPTEPASQPPGRPAIAYWRLPDILERTVSYKCTDPRDKLYSILSLFAQPVPELLRPNYSKTKTQMMTDLAWFMIDYDLPLALSKASEGRQDPRMPSWVADWSIAAKAGTMNRVGRPWRAGFATGRKQMFVSRSDNVLIARGRVVDIVEACSNAWSSPEPQKIAEDVMGYMTGLECLGGFCDNRRCWEVHVRQPEKTCQRLKLRPSDFGRTISDFDDHPALAYVCARATEAYDELYRGDSVLHDAEGVRCLNILATRRPDEHFSLHDAMQEIALLCKNRRAIVSREGLQGIGHANTRPGDVICVLLGVQVPFILRPIEQGWSLVGECLVGGIMDGEAVELLDWDKIMAGEVAEPLQDFQIH